MPISAILFGGRRATAVPLVTESFDWNHGVFLGANVASEKTAAAEGKVGELRRDPFAMLPFCGYNMGDYMGHWVDVAKDKDQSKLPKIYYVNWFRKDDEGKFVWPGFGENGRVLKWIVERLEGKADGVETAIGVLPTKESLDTDGLDLADADLEFLLSVDKEVWREEGGARPRAPQHLRRPHAHRAVGPVPQPGAAPGPTVPTSSAPSGPTSPDPRKSSRRPAARGLPRSSSSAVPRSTGRSQPGRVPAQRRAEDPALHHCTRASDAPQRGAGNCAASPRRRKAANRQPAPRRVCKPPLQPAQ